MEDNLTVLGAEGLIRKIEFVRIIIQCLYSLGYSRSAYCLEIESGIRCRSPELELLESQVLNGSWDDCISTLNSLEDLTDGTRASALFLVYKQYIMEFLKQGMILWRWAYCGKRFRLQGLIEEKFRNSRAVSFL